MITCPECSATNKSNAQFCGECGAYLAWESMVQLGPSAPPIIPVPASAGPLAETEVVADSSRDSTGAESEPADATAAYPTSAGPGSPAPTGAPQAAPPAEGPPTQTSQPIAQPRPDAAAQPDSTSDRQAQSKRMAAAAAMRKPVSRTGPNPTTTTPGPPPSDPAADHGEPRLAGDRPAPEAPTDSEQPTPDETPKARLPGESEHHHGATQPTAEIATDFPGGTACRECGVGNDPRSIFCLRCGTPLVAPPTVTPSQTAHEPNAAPWYKRRFVYDRPDHGPAGSRPKTLAHEVRRRRNRATTLGVSLTVALTAAVTSWGFGDDLARTREQALDRMKDLAVVQPVSAESGSSAKGHDAKKTLDDNPDTWWQPRGKSKVLTYEFGEATRLVGIVIRPAKSAVSPMRIQVKAYGGEAYSEPTLKENWEWDGKTIAKVLIMQASDVARVSLEVLETDGVPPENVAISEVEFATRKSEATPSPTG